VLHLLRGWSVVLLYFGYFLMPPTFAWYLLPLIALASLVVSPTIRACTLTLGCTALLMNMIGLMADPSFAPPRVVSWSVWWVPPVVVLLWMRREQLRSLSALTHRTVTARALFREL
jgi:hypothetical protein